MNMVHLSKSLEIRMNGVARLYEHFLFKFRPSSSTNLSNYNVELQEEATNSISTERGVDTVDVMPTADQSSTVQQTTAINDGILNSNPVTIPPPLPPRGKHLSLTAMSTDNQK